MDYELYHDESKEAGYWHGIFLIPVIAKEKLCNLLMEIRKQIKYSSALGIKNIRKRNKIFSCARSWIQVGATALIQQKFLKNENPIYVKRSFDGKVKKDVILYLNNPIKAKFILFREKDNHKKMDSYRDYGSKVETTFRIGLKGGMHFLGDDDEPINIVSMHFDGHEHYRRNISKDRIINRMIGLRSYCSFDKDILIDDKTSNHNKNNCQNYLDCQILQLTDLLVGSFRTVLGKQTNVLHSELACPVENIIKKYQQGYARMKNSRWYRGFCMSQCYIDDNGFVFEEIKTTNDDEVETLKLPF